MKPYEAGGRMKTGVLFIKKEFLDTIKEGIYFLL
jgi:hypothetical protein